MANGNSKKPPVIIPPKPPKPEKHFKVYTIRVYAIDGAYNSEMIDEFEYKAAHLKSFGGQFIREAESEVQVLVEHIGKHGHTIETPTGGKLYYPPHRIYYVEAERSTRDKDDD